MRAVAATAEPADASTLVDTMFSPAARGELVLSDALVRVAVGSS